MVLYWGINHISFAPIGPFYPSSPPLPYCEIRFGCLVTGSYSYNTPSSSEAHPLCVPSQNGNVPDKPHAQIQMFFRFPAASFGQLAGSILIGPLAFTVMILGMSRWYGLRVL